jgi:hypothetical protein
MRISVHRRRLRVLCLAIALGFRVFKPSASKDVLALDLLFGAQGKAMSLCKIQGRGGRSANLTMVRDWCFGVPRQWNANGTPLHTRGGCTLSVCS